MSPRIRKTNMEQSGEDDIFRFNRKYTEYSGYRLIREKNTVDQENEGTYLEGLLVPDWAQIYKQSLVTIADQGSLTHAALLGKGCLPH